MTKQKQGALRLYRSYMFRDKDPVIDALRTLRSDADMGYSKTEQGGGPKATTISNWEKGKTRRPQFATVAAAARTWGAMEIRFDGQGRPYFVTRQGPVRNVRLVKTKAS